ncbi:DNA methyltransferase, partial [Mycobacterium tuberculosis]|uniref:DNA methyltransferase n=1 Tax=Mycobacterium tuberculosis TaxID=1773 RepID=UPI002235183D
MTDPPYNLRYGGTGYRKIKKAGFRKFANDSLSEREYRRFTLSWLKEAYRILKPGRHIYVCIDWRQYPLICWLMKHVGFGIKNCLVWDKMNMGMGYHYRFRHEFIIFAVKDTSKNKNRSLSVPNLKPLKNRRIRSRSITDV